MRKRFIKICNTCGTKYEYCSSCLEFAKKPYWMNMFHSEDCKDLYIIASDYYNGDKSEEETKELIDCISIPETIVEQGIEDLISKLYHKNEAVEQIVEEEIEEKHPVRKSRKIKDEE